MKRILLLLLGIVVGGVGALATFEGRDGNDAEASIGAPLFESPQRARSGTLGGAPGSESPGAGITGRLVVLTPAA